MIATPFELDDTVVSDIKITIGSESIETFNDKSRIVKVILEPISKVHIFIFLLHIHSPKFPSHTSPCLLDFVTDGFGVGVVIEVNARWKVTYPRFPKASNVVDSIFFLGEGKVEHMVDGCRSHDFYNKNINNRRFKFYL